MVINRQKIMYLGRWMFGFLLMVFLLVKIQWRSLADIFKNISLPYLIALLGLSIILIWVSCLKWKLFLDERGQRISILNLMSLYLLGYFFNHFLPSQYGGDLVRSYELGREIESQITSFGSVFMERYTGLIALITVSSSAALLLPRLVGNAKVGMPFLVAWLAFIVSVWFIYDKRPVNYITGRFSDGRLGHIMTASEKLYREISASSRNPGLLLKAIALSLLFHWLAVVNTYLVVLAIRSRVDFISLMVVVPIILMVSMIPLTVNSIGLFEGAFVYFFAPLGLSGAEALSVALVLRGKNIITAVLGGIVYLNRARKRG